MYALNLADFVANKDDILKMLLGPVISNDVVECEKRRIDGAAIQLKCGDDRAQAIIEIIRKKYKRYQLRLYSSSNGNNWKRV